VELLHGSAAWTVTAAWKWDLSPTYQYNSPASANHPTQRSTLPTACPASPSWFRQQLHPGITFQGKGGAFSSGLQVADLLDWPCDEKLLNPEADPARWEEFRAKLCPGKETKNSLIGLKVVPWDAGFSDIWRPPAIKSGRGSGKPAALPPTGETPAHFDFSLLDGPVFGPENCHRSLVSR
jgi:hypothetical protein